MFPSFEFLGKTINTYAIAALAGALLAGFYSCRVTKKRGLDDNDTLVLLLISAIGVLIGGHLLYGVTQYKFIFAVIADPSHITSFSDFLSVLTYAFGGAVFYGGLLGGICAGAIYLKKKKLDFGIYSDIVAPAVPLFHAFGRIGCFLGGCCYGVECSFGITSTLSPDTAANGVPRFPVQLLESAFNLLLFAVLAILFKKNKCRKKLFLIYLLIYSTGRFLLEFLRGDAVRGFIFGLSTSQLISVLIFSVCCVVLAFKRKKHIK